MSQIALLEYQGPEPTGFLVLGTKILTDWPLEEASAERVQAILQALGYRVEVLDVSDLMWAFETSLDGEQAHHLEDLPVAAVLQHILDEDDLEGLEKPMTPERARAILEALVGGGDEGAR